MAEVAWPAEPVEAKFEGCWLHFIDPEGNRNAIPTSPGFVQIEDSETPVWEAERLENGLVRISPSIHLEGHYHTPNPVMFKLVDELNYG